MNIRPDEWDAMDWFEQQLYIEGLSNEGILQSEGDTSSPAGPVKAELESDFLTNVTKRSVSASSGDMFKIAPPLEAASSEPPPEMFKKVTAE